MNFKTELREVIIYNDDKTAEVARGKFHLWGKRIVPSRIGVETATVAIVELEDGSVTEAYPWNIAFVNKQIKGKEKDKLYSLRNAINELGMNRPFVDNEFQEAIDISIKSLQLQYEMERYCKSHDCTECRAEGVCAKTFMLDELQ